jgi:hypothetical protein
LIVALYPAIFSIYMTLEKQKMIVDKEYFRIQKEELFARRRKERAGKRAYKKVVSPEEDTDE